METKKRQWQPQRDNILLAAYAKLPVGTSAQRLYDNLVLVLIVERQTGCIKQAEVSFVTQAARDFLAELLCGYNLNQGAEPILQLLQEVYFGPLKKALLSAVKMAAAQYAEAVANQPAPGRTV